MNIDIAIVVTFLAITLIVGLGHGQKVKGIKDYALGGRNFSTAALVATIVATWASGSGFFIMLSKTYSSGFYYLFASIGGGLSLLISAFILIPRMGEFLGKVSIAEAMGDLYGSKVQLITAVAATIGSAGLIAVQFKAFGNVVSYFLQIPSGLAITIAGLIATIYSAFGGIRAVTFTDILQFFAFGVIIPLLGFIIWSNFYNLDYSVSQAFAEPQFNLGEMFSMENPGLLGMLVLFCYFAIPTTSAATFQRISIGRDIAQVKKAFMISAIIYVAIKFLIAWIPFLIHIINPYIDTGSLLGYVVDNYSFTGLKGLTIVAIIAFAMSSADSRINSAAVLFTNDIFNLCVKNRQYEILISRIFACILGIGSIAFSLMETDLLGIILFAESFYLPTIFPVFLLTVLGFRSSTKSVLIGMSAGLFITILWQLLPIEFAHVSQEVIGIFVAMLCNAIFLLGSHYVLKQPGGWVGVKDRRYLDEEKVRKSERRARIQEWFNNFSIMGACRDVAPATDATYTLLGVYFIVCTFTTMYSTQVKLLGAHGQLMLVMYQLMMVTGTVIAMYPLWPISVARRIKESIILVWWPIAIFYMLIFFSCFFVIVSKFAMLQVSLFGINLMIASILLGWRLSLLLILTGLFLSIRFYQFIFGEYSFESGFASPEFILVYVVILVATSVITFLKPKEERQAESDATVDVLKTEVTHLDYEVTNLNSQVTDLSETVTHYSERVEDQSKEIERLGATAQRIINNVNHELRLPVGNVVNFAEMLHDGLGKFDENQMKMLSDEVYKNSNRLSSMILNMLDLATLDAKKIELDKSTVNFSELVKDRVKSCRKIYLQGKRIDFKLRIDPEILISVDPNYIRQTVDNLVINAINFSEEGTINISVLRKDDAVEFTISDQGMGIPKSEIYDIFTPFKMGSNTESKSEGRGIGLALCRSAIEAHGGIISVESNGSKGAKFSFSLLI